MGTQPVTVPLTRPVFRARRFGMAYLRVQKLAGSGLHIRVHPSRPKFTVCGLCDRFGSDAYWRGFIRMYVSPDQNSWKTCRLECRSVCCCSAISNGYASSGVVSFRPVGAGIKQCIATDHVTHVAMEFFKVPASVRLKAEFAICINEDELAY